MCPVQKNKKSLWNILFLLLLVFLTFYYIFRKHELGALLKTMSEANPLYLALGFALMFVFVASEGYGIKVLLNSLDYKLSYMKCLKYSFLGFYYCNVTPSSGGQPVQIYYMTKEGIAFGDSSLSIMLISIAYQIGIVLICLFALIMKFSFVMRNLGTFGYFSLLGAAVNLFIVGFFISTTFRNTFIEKAAAFVIMGLSKLRLIKAPEKKTEQFLRHLEKYRQGAAYLKKHPKVLLVTLFSIVIQILTRLSIAYVVYRAFGLHGYSYLDILSLQAFLALGVEYLPIPGSVGAAEAGFYAVNRTVFGADKLLSATLLTRGISFYAFLIISGAVSIYAHFLLSRGAPKASISDG